MSETPKSVFFRLPRPKPSATSNSGETPKKVFLELVRAKADRRRAVLILPNSAFVMAFPVATADHFTPTLAAALA